MKSKNYIKPDVLVIDYISKNNLMIGIDDESTDNQMGNEASVKPFEDEEDENEARRNHEVWDDEE